VRGFELWGRAVAIRQELEQLWDAMARDAACAEYVALRRGTALTLDGVRACLRELPTPAECR
jgi:hypothetical protein